MGKFFAALIIVLLVGWLSPMCARLPDDLSTVSAPAAPVAPVVSTATAPAPEPAVAPPAPKPAPKPALDRPITVATFRSRSMFPVENGKYVVSVLRANRAEVPATGVRMTLTTRMQGEIVERAESGPAQSLAAGSTSYFGLTISTVVLDAILDGPEDRRSGLEWALSYHLDGDAPGSTRCFRLRALPRRREPSGISWVPLGESQKCDPAGTPADAPLR
ncbi:MAG: hypothetical protein PHS14_13780 [Elusimicrobia bacterium]|nr:hypothetical protein [Elusimicrobiota bacterium]